MLTLHFLGCDCTVCLVKLIAMFVFFFPPFSNFCLLENEQLPPVLIRSCVIQPTDTKEKKMIDGDNFSLMVQGAISLP